MPEAKVFFEHDSKKMEMSAPTFMQLWSSCKYFMHPWKREIQAIFKVFKIAEVETAIDVGACIGIFPVMLSRLNPSMKIYALEPASVNYRYLLGNTIHLPNVQCLKMAASSELGQIEIALPTLAQKNWGVPRDQRENTGIISVYGKSDFYREKVDAIRLDGLVSHCDFIKIDAEGHDLAVIEGAKGLLETSRPLILMETHKYNMQMAGVTLQDLLDLCNEIDYTGVYRWRHDLVLSPVEKIGDYNFAMLAKAIPGLKIAGEVEDVICGGGWVKP